MSVKVSSWVWHETPDEIKGNRLVALLALADIADDEGLCRFAEDTSQAALAKKSRMAVSTFREVTDWLMVQGYLVASRPNQTTNKEYRIILSAEIRRSLVEQMTAGNQRSDRQNPAVTAPKSGGHSSIDVLNVRDVSTSDAGASDFSEDVVRLCRLLALLVSQNGHKVGKVGKVWWSACERLMRLDGYTVEQIEIIIRWSTANEFWSANIRSMPKLREKFSTLRAQRNTELSKRKKTSTVAHGAEVDELLRARESKQLAVTA